MLCDLTFLCYVTTFSGKKCLIGKVICAFFVPLIEVLLYLIFDRSWRGRTKSLIQSRVDHGEGPLVAPEDLTK
jgi:hypothetical protein